MVEKPGPAYRGDQPYIFVSYAHVDMELVYPEIEWLTNQGFNVWYDEGISPGSVWREELARAIEHCSLFLLYVSEGTNASDHCMKELSFALDSGRRLLAVHLEVTELSAGLRLSLSDRQAILKYELADAAYRETLEGALRSQVQVFREPVSQAPRVAKRKKAQRIAIAAAILMGLGLASWLVPDNETESPDDRQALEALPFADRPVIAVLPFRNLSSEADDDYFVMGLTEDLIDRLASWRRFPVVGSYSSATYQDSTMQPRQIAEELGARYLVQGSVRRAKDTVRINVGLYDASSGVQIWSERYDQVFTDVLTLQDEISEAVVRQMYPKLNLFDQKRAIRRAPQNMTAWDLTQQGWWHFSRETEQGNRLAKASYRKASELDPTSATAVSGLALAHYASIVGGWTDDPEHSIEQLIDAAERSVALDPQDPMSQHALGHAHALSGNRRGMVEAFTTSLELNPSSTLIAACAGEGFAMAGEFEPAIDALNTALRLGPKDPFAYANYHSLALAHFAAGRYEEAATWARRSLSVNPQFVFALRTLATSLANSNQLEAARTALHRATQLEPVFTLAGVGRYFLAAKPAVAERYRNGLRQAGLD